MINRKLKLALFCAGIFACGVVAGTFGARSFWTHPKPPDGFGPRTMHRLTTELGLTQEQRVQIEPLIDRAADDLKRLRRESWRQSSAVVEAMDAGVSTVLTPEQRKRFKELKAAQRSRMQAAMEERQRRRSENEAWRRDGGERPSGPGAPPPDMEREDSR